MKTYTTSSSVVSQPSQSASNVREAHGPGKRYGIGEGLYSSIWASVRPMIGVKHQLLTQ